MGKREEKELRDQSGNSNPSEDETREGIILDETDYSASATVYKITSGRAGHGSLPKLELGRNERKVINCGVNLARLFMASDTPLPLQCVITHDEKKLYYGKRFELEKDVSTNVKFAHELAEIVGDGVINFISVALVAGFPFVYITYGRHGLPEYFANAYLGGKPYDE